MEQAMKKASFMDTMKTVLAGAVGVRRKVDHDRAQINPLHLVFAAIIFVALFIGTLLTIVKLVLSQS